MSTEIVMSVEQAAELMGCSVRRVFELLSEGVLERAPRFGRSTRIYRASVEAALAPRVKRSRKPRRNAPARWAISDVPLERAP